MPIKPVKTVLATEEEISKVCEKAQQQIFAKVLEHYKNHPGNAWSGKYLVDLEKTLSGMYKDLGINIGAKFKKGLPKTMREFYDRAAEQLKTAGVRKNLLGKPDTDRINYFLNNSFEQIAMRTTKMSFEHKKQLRSISAEVLRVSSLTGDTRQQVTKQLLEKALEIPGFKFTDNGGRVWKDEAYFKMLARTELMNAGRAAYDDKCTAEGCDVVVLDFSGNSCEACTKYEGQLFSLTGATPGLPTKADLEAAGVFHPNCTHSYSAVPGYSDNSKIDLKEEKTDRNQFPTDLENIKTIRSLGGTTGAKLVEDQFGNQYVYKTGGTAGGNPAAHLRNEAAADIFYRAAGIDVPECKVYETKNGPVKLSRYIDGGTSLHDYWQKATPEEKEKLLEKLRPGFDADVLLGNWDVTGTGADNILIDKNGKPWRIDNGGALGFRAQGMPKKPDEWASGWPDDLWSMRTSSNNSPYFGNISTLDLCSSISNKNWDDAIAKLPQSEQNIVKKRLEEIRQLSARGNDFHSNGYAPKYTEIILSDSYELSKAGFREKMRFDVSLGSDNLPKDYGPFRTHGKTSSASSNPDALKDQNIKDKIVAAAKTVNFHNSDSGDHKPNQTTIDAAVSLKSELDKLAASGNTGAQYYLRKIEQIEKAAAAGTTISGKHVGDVPVYVSSKPKAKRVQDSFTTQVFDHIKSKKVNGIDIDLDPNFIPQCQKSQGGNSFDKNACKMKIVRLNTLGIDPSDASKKGYFTGISQYQKDNWNKAVDYYKNNPDELARDTETYVRYQSALSLALENSKMPCNYPESRSMILGRTEDDKVVANSKQGGELKAKHGVNESHAMFQTVIVGGDNLTMVRVPYSRISGIFMAESKPGSNSCAFLGDTENEADADTNGLHVLYIGKVKSGESLEKYRAQYLAWEKNKFK